MRTSPLTSCNRTALAQAGQSTGIRLLATAALLLLALATAAAATVPAGFTEIQVATGLTKATAMAFAPDGRLFVCEQGGTLRVIKNGKLLATPFVSITVDSTTERGLIGVAVDPNFATNHWIYVHYTATSPTVHNRISRFTANGDVAVPGSEAVIFELNTQSKPVHQGGAIHFGADGRLYISVGDNALTPNTSQSLSNLFGKLLRIGKHGAIPTDNPFYNAATGKSRAIWALGLRNPYTFDVQRGTGRIFINDVGQDTWEEINDGASGANYGWNITEGPTTDPRFVSPLFSYGHGAGDTLGCAITGGAFYNPPTVTYPSAYLGVYFFADFCNGWINKLDDPTVSAPTASGFATGIDHPVDLAVSPVNGSLYYLARGNGTTTTGKVVRIKAQ